MNIISCTSLIMNIWVSFFFLSIAFVSHIIFDMVVLFAQSCLTLCNPIDCSLQGPSVHRILQARILEWVAISFSRESSWPRDWIWVSCIAGRFFTIWATRETPTFLAVLHSIWDLISWARDQTLTPWIGRQSLNHWTTREAPFLFFFGIK